MPDGEGRKCDEFVGGQPLDGNICFRTRQGIASLKRKKKA
jgi:hypothetical protein